MITVASLWMPVLLSAVLVFFASSLIHMVFKWHNAEYRKLPNEDAVRAVVGAYGAHALPPVVVCMGPITAAAASDAGIEVTAVADPHTLDGLVAATIAAFAARR